MNRKLLTFSAGVLVLAMVGCSGAGETTAPPDGAAGATGSGGVDGTGGSDGTGGTAGCVEGKVAERTRYRAAQVPFGESCDAETQTRTCENGSWSDWSGGFGSETCSVAPAPQCTDGSGDGSDHRIRYASSSVPYGAECQSELQTRTCTADGWSEFSGTFTSESCEVEFPADCDSLPHGQSASRVRYASETAAYSAGSAQETQYAECTDGELGAWSGSYGFEACTVLPPVSCGETAHGGTTSRVRYQSATVPYGEECVSEEQSSTCNDGAFGTWSGTYAFEECVVLPPSGCGDTPHGETGTRERYQTGSVPYGGTCVSETQSAVCDNGTFGEWSGSFTYAACAVGTPANCYPWANHGQTIERIRYSVTTVAYGEVCPQETQTQTCNNGVLSPWTGTYPWSSCSVMPPKGCGLTPHGGTESRVAYESGNVLFGTSCVSESQTRTCNNGTWGSWSGTYLYTTCSPNECATGAVQTQACGRNGRGTQTKTCTSFGRWPYSWSSCVDPDVCDDGDERAVSCAPAAGWHDDTCVSGQWQQSSTCGSCSGTFYDPCLENHTTTECFAASYNGLACGVWNMNFFPARCETSLNYSVNVDCSDIHSEDWCYWGSCSWTWN